MKKILVITVLFCTVSYLFTLDITAEFNIGNLNLWSDRAETDTAFDAATYPWGLGISIGQNLSENARLNIGYSYDTVLRSVATATLLYKEEYFSVEVGPFFGVFNSVSQPLNSGITTLIKAQVPGYVFISLRTDSSLAARIVDSGDYYQKRNDIIFGIYVPNAICRLSLLTKDFIQKNELVEVGDGLTQYLFSIEIFRKNVPFIVLVNLGYQNMTKTFSSATVSRHNLGSVILGTELSWQITSYLNVKYYLTSNIYSFGFRNDQLLTLPTEGFNAFIFNTGLGVTLNLDQLASR